MFNYHLLDDLRTSLLLGKHVMRYWTLRLLWSKRYHQPLCSLLTGSSPLWGQWHFTVPYVSHSQCGENLWYNRGLHNDFFFFRSWRIIHLMHYLQSKALLETQTWPSTDNFSSKDWLHQEGKQWIICTSLQNILVEKLGKNNNILAVGELLTAKLSQ